MMKLFQKSQNSAISQSYFKLSGFLLLTGILLTGVIMICSAVTSYQKTIENSIRQNSDALINNIKESYFMTKNISSMPITRLIQNAKLEYNYEIFLYDETGKELYPGDSGETRILTPAVRSYISRDDFMEMGYYTSNASEAQVCYATRFYLEDTGKNVLQYYLASVSNAGVVQEYTMMLAMNLVLCLVIMTLLFLFLFRIGTKRMDSQLDELTQVVNQYAEGEFSARVNLPEQSNLYAFGCTLSRMAEFIEHNETTRKNFVANVSHELRTPMTTIAGFADGMLDGTIPPAQQKKYLKIITEEIHRLKTLVQSMLNLTKFEAGEMQLRIAEVDIAQLLIRTVLMFEKRITDKKVEVEGLEDVSLKIFADEDLISQVLYNLIENAVKFVNTGGTITFSLSSEKQFAHICIKNTGEGLADDELPKIFDRFYKTDASRSQDKTGLGLGLSISQKIVHLHQGHIVVKSVQGEYTSFEVQIPTNLKADILAVKK